MLRNYPKENTQKKKLPVTDDYKQQMHQTSVNVHRAHHRVSLDTFQST
jgi:hypothetical protein